MPSRIQGVGPNPKKLHFMFQLPEFGVERLSHVTVCHHEPSPEHSHPVMQLLWILSGELRMKIGENRHLLKAGSLIVLPARMPHRPESSDAHPAVEMLDMRLLPPIASYAESKLKTFTSRFSCKSLQARVGRLQGLCGRRGPPDTAEILACVWEMLFLAGRRTAQHGKPAEPRREIGDARIHAAEAIMHLHLESPISIEDLAAQVNVSATHLTRLFRQIRKAGPGTVFRRMRMERARELLTGSCLSVKEIGEKCGFAGFNQFVRAFGREFGTSPGAFRKTGIIQRHV